MVSSWNMLAAVDPEGGEAFKVNEVPVYSVYLHGCARRKGSSAKNTDAMQGLHPSS